MLRVCVPLSSLLLLRNWEREKRRFFDLLLPTLALGSVRPHVGNSIRYTLNGKNMHIDVQAKNFLQTIVSSVSVQISLAISHRRKFYVWFAREMNGMNIPGAQAPDIYVRRKKSLL